MTVFTKSLRNAKYSLENAHTIFEEELKEKYHVKMPDNELNQLFSKLVEETLTRYGTNKEKILQTLKILHNTFNKDIVIISQLIF